MGSMTSGNDTSATTPLKGAVERSGDSGAAGAAETETGEPASKAFWRWIKSFRPSRRARLAAPGLSRHGRARAIDFQIKKDGEIIAGTSAGDIETSWRAEGWDEKLKASIEAAGPSFRGPLTSPDEPWHYDYEPKVAE